MPGASLHHLDLLSNYSNNISAPILNPSNQTKVIKGEIADYWIDSNGILFSFSKSQKQTLQNIKENIELVKEITGHKKVPLLIYQGNINKSDKAAREFSSQQLPDMYTAMALVSKPGLSKLLMNLSFKFKTPPIPIRLFSNGSEAKEWLKQYL